jgi:hypothetical protein
MDMLHFPLWAFVGEAGGSLSNPPRFFRLQDAILLLNKADMFFEEYTHGIISKLCN